MRPELLPRPNYIIYSYTLSAIASWANTQKEPFNELLERHFVGAHLNPRQKEVIKGNTHILRIACNVDIFSAFWHIRIVFVGLP